VELANEYCTDFGSITLKGYPSWPEARHPFGERQRAVIKAVAQRFWEEGGDVSDLVLEREAT
jgi:hypothetical protein